MGFASTWLEKRTLFPEFISDIPGSKTGIIIVVPAYNEPGITMMLDSLLQCMPPECESEVIIVINAPPEAPGEHLMNNRKSVEDILKWKEQNTPFFRLFSIEAPSLEGWGVGMARKTGMDEALRRFDHTGNTEGVILCLDADCTVTPDYFTAVENDLLRRKDRQACSIYFEHPLSDAASDSSIIKYELHLRYYIRGLEYAGFPYAFHTVGSSMAVKAGAYMKAGGMNRKKAGEDFYFIQKLVILGGFFSLNETTVFPSPRQSFRVPFGTGAMMEKLGRDTGGDLLTYDTRAFIELKNLFAGIRELYTSNLSDHYRKLGTGVRSFITEEEFIYRIEEIRNNTSGYLSFRKRFFTWFNMFRIIKFMNHVHENILKRKPVYESAMKLLDLQGIDTGITSGKDLLMFYRSMEKKA